MNILLYTDEGWKISNLYIISFCGPHEQKEAAKNNNQKNLPFVRVSSTVYKYVLYTIVKQVSSQNKFFNSSFLSTRQHDQDSCMRC